MAIEVKQKKFAKSPLWVNALLVVSIILLTSIISGYFVFDYFTSEAKKESKEIASQLAIEISLEERLREEQIRIDDFATILKDRSNLSNFFPFFEKLSHPTVWFNELKLNLETSNISSLGQTETFRTLGQQYLIFKEEEMLSNVKLADIELDEQEGKVNFSFGFSFDNKILND